MICSSPATLRPTWSARQFAYVGALALKGRDGPCASRHR
jgi:hypothetical protein